ncbi:MAG: tyrosine--tRNA ligase [Coriobacteriia bacterium]|nr:tyrosine--tRNA ligase [Coriobacteriia bacterium]
MRPATEQMHIIKSGGASIIPEAALLDKLKLDQPLRIKFGVDPTAPDLHLGHAVPLRKLRQFQELGHTVVLIIGNGTAMIGDPSGRNATRPPLSEEAIAVNAATYVEQAFKILDDQKTELTWNKDWLGELRLTDIIKLTGQFTVARILERDDFANRYNNQQPISLHEFLYPVIQAYDSVAIKADVEMGGSDQLFNLLAGRDLMERLDMEPQVCITLPLLEGTDGVQKMSKSYGNSIGITEPPNEMFGKLMSIPDEVMPRYLFLASSFTVDESDEMISQWEAGDLHPNTLKRRLAINIVSAYHSASEANAAEAEFDRIHRQHEAPTDIEEVAIELLVEKDGLVYLPAVMQGIGFATSASEARRLIDGGGVQIDGVALNNEEYRVAPDRLKDAVIQAGRRRFVRLLVK